VEEAGAVARRNLTLQLGKQLGGVRIENPFA
jgi:hypothetical protein